MRVACPSLVNIAELLQPSITTMGRFRCLKRPGDSLLGSEPYKLPVQCRRAEASPKFSTSNGNNFWEFSDFLGKLLPVLVFQGCRNGRFGKRSFYPLPKTGGLTKIGENSDVAFCPQKQGILLLGPRKSTKMTKMAGVTPAK